MTIAEEFSNLSILWHEVKLNYSDPRTTHWFLMESPMPTTIVCLIYLVFVLNGHRIMKNREALKLNNVLIVYNFLMVLTSAYLTYEFLVGGWLLDYSLGCQPVNYSFEAKPLRMASVCWVFYFSKIVELLDTVFFILRKKFNQVSFLHVFHHGIMPLSMWFGVKFAAGGFGTFFGLVNSFIHFVMYSYYGLSACGERIQKYLWWKKYITQMQMLQFILVMIHASQLFFIECNYPLIFVYFIILYAFIFLVFFSNFFIHEYILKNKSIQKTKSLKNGHQTNGKTKHS